MNIQDTVPDCCTGTSPCPVRYEVTVPCAGIRTGKDGKLYCAACSLRLNKQTPRYCPGCGRDLWKQAKDAPHADRLDPT